MTRRPIKNQSDSTGTDGGEPAKVSRRRLNQRGGRPSDSLRHRLERLTALLARLWSSPPMLGALGAMAAVVLTCAVNILASRFYQRWDATPSGTYTLSDSTLATLRQLEEPTEVIVFLSREDPLYSSLRLLLDEYSTASARSKGAILASRYIDPDRSIAEFVAVQRELGIFEGKTQEGRLVSDTSIVVRQGPRRWLISPEDLVGVEPDGTAIRPQLEQALTQALHRVTREERSTVCFTSGHRELGDGQGRLESIDELKRRLERDNHNLRSINLKGSSRGGPFEGCALVVVPAPGLAWTRDQVEKLDAYFERGGNILAALPPIVSDDGSLSSAGFEPLLEPLGLRVEPHVVIEQQSERIPATSASGAVFLAEPQSHPITTGLSHGETTSLVRVEFATEISIFKTSDALPLLASSPNARVLANLRGDDSRGELATATGLGSAPGRFTAAAYERAPTSAGSQSGEPSTKSSRLVVLGSASHLDASVWTDPRRLDDRAFIESTLAWLLAEPPLVSVPAQQSHPAGLSLTQAGLDEVIRYVLVYMPVTALMLGGLVLYRRRRSYEPAASSSESRGAAWR